MTNRISRRVLAKGAAWTIPSVLVASAAPAFASSACDPLTNQVTLNMWDGDIDETATAWDPESDSSWVDGLQQFQYRYSISAKDDQALPAGAQFVMGFGFSVKSDTTPTLTPETTTGIASAASNFSRSESSPGIDQYNFRYTVTLTQDLLPGETVTGIIDVSRDFDPFAGFETSVVQRIGLPDQTFVMQCQTVTITSK